MSSWLKIYISLQSAANQFDDPEGFGFTNFIQLQMQKGLYFSGAMGTFPSKEHQWFNHLSAQFPVH